MLVVSITALGVGGATAVGALLGFALKRIPRKYNDAILGFAAGVMLAAAVFGLIVPALETGGKYIILTVTVGILAGALLLSYLDKVMPHLHNLAGVDIETHAEGTEKIDKLLLFVLAIAIHNFPEGLAAGVSFGTGDIGNALVVAGGIALQNIPEGMVIISPLIIAGASGGRALALALATGLVEVVGTFFGYFAVSVSGAILPFALAFAGGTMLYVISDEMIPETHSHGFEKSVTFSIIIGFIVVMIMDFYIR
ncbi:MAG TPA: ZIP family metal transporter [Clostridiales bacterium]|nr:ZIP family metal transporter [Clostridiales bacterium]